MPTTQMLKATSTALARPTRALPILISLLGPGMAAHASEDAPPPSRIALGCVEEPARQVVFDGKGQVNYTEVAAPSSEPITLAIIKTGIKTGTDSRPKEAYAIEPARIESKASWLARARAVWSSENRIDADNGRLRIDLSDNRLYLTEANSDGSALFRRFQCERLGLEQSATTPER